MQDQWQLTMKSSSMLQKQRLEINSQISKLITKWNQVKLKSYWTQEINMEHLNTYNSELK